MLSIKEIARLITPPILIIIKKRILAYGAPTSSNTYEGIYSSFDEVKKKYLTSGNYSTPQSSADALSYALLSLGKFKNNDLPYDGVALIRHNFLPTFLSGVPEHEINILDVGGGYCRAYFSSSYSCPTKEIRSTSVELSKIVSDGVELFKDISNLDLIEEIPKNNNEKFNVINFGSSLQYFENFRNVLKDLIRLKIKYFIISDTPMGTFETFVCAQMNVNPIIPRLVFNIDELMSLFALSGYELVHKSVNYYSHHNFDNYEQPHSSARYVNLIFCRP